MQAVIVGAGLAGMTVAWELAARGVQVRLIEANSYAGGKASAVRWGDYWEDHGFHIFPAWYRNTRRLLGQIGCAGNLIDLHLCHHLVRGKYPQYITMYEWNSLRNAWRNLRCGLLAPLDMALSSYFLLDLAAAALSNESYLDRVSANGYLRSRFYATERIAVQHHNQVLQASSIPGYEVSAKTIQNVIQAWLWNPTPFVSILNGNLQHKFIDPFAQHLEQRLGVQILRGWKAVRLMTDGGRVVGVQMHESERRGDEIGKQLEKTSGADFYVVATAPKEAHALVDGSLFEAELSSYWSAATDRRGLADIVFLRSAPMAALHVHFTRTLPHIPKEHTMLKQSRFGSAFVDVSQHWDGLDHTALNIIPSNVEPLQKLADYQIIQYLLGELQEYIPFAPGDIGIDFDVRDPSVDLSNHPERQQALKRRCFLQMHVGQPLFLNTVGAWHFRPRPRTGIPNLFVAGDYCQSGADLTTMESAVMSALSTARAILDDAGIASDVGPLDVPRPQRWMLRLAKYALLPVIAPLALWTRLRDMGTKP